MALVVNATALMTSMPPYFLCSRVFPRVWSESKSETPPCCDQTEAISLINAALVAHFKEMGASLRVLSASPPNDSFFHPRKRALSLP